MMTHVNLSRLNPYNLHKHLINEYFLKKPGDTNILRRNTSKDKTDFDVIKQNHQFLWNNTDVADSWEKQLAKRYYDKLFKEYCICDLSRYKENKVALRWRVEKELIAGKGQFTCGSKLCLNKESLRSWEVNFAYIENNEKKNALVKLRLCPDCSDKLNYKSKKREIKRIKTKSKKLKTYTDISLNESAEVQKANNSQRIFEEPQEVENNNTATSVDQDNNMRTIEQSEQNLWKKGPEIEEKTREEEFDEYLENLLL